MSAATVAAVAAVAAVGTSVYSASQQAGAQKDALNQNKAAQDQANAINYERWMASRGVDASGNPVNTKLPIYMTSTPFSSAPTPPRFRVAGGSPNPGGLVGTPSTPAVYAPRPPAAPQLARTVAGMSTSPLAGTTPALVDPTASAMLQSVNSANAAPGAATPTKAASAISGIGDQTPYPSGAPGMGAFSQTY